MFFYIITFMLSLWGIYKANIYYARSRVLFFFFSFIAIVPPILLAGFRAEGVGSDTSFYILPIFEDAISCNGNWDEFLSSTWKMEIFYLYLNYVVSIFTHNSIVFLTIVHSFIIIPFYIVSIKWRKHLSPVFFFFIFYCIYYQESMSTVRQSIAMGFAMLGFSALILEKKRLHFIIFSVLSIGFHNTAVLALIFPLLYKVAREYPIKRFGVYYFIIGSICICGFMYFDRIIMWLASNGFLNEKYMIYTSESDTFSGGLVMSNFIIKIVMAAYFLFLCIKTNNYWLTTFFLMIALLDLIFSACGIIISHLIRLSLYPRIMNCISLPITLDRRNSYIRYSKNQFYIKVLFCILLIFYWYYLYIYSDYAATSVYELSFNLLFF